MHLAGLLFPCCAARQDEWTPTCRGAESTSSITVCAFWLLLCCNFVCMRVGGFEACFWPLHRIFMTHLFARMNGLKSSPNYFKTKKSIQFSTALSNSFPAFCVLRDSSPLLYICRKTQASYHLTAGSAALNQKNIHASPICISRRSLIAFHFQSRANAISLHFKEKVIASSHG